MLSVAMLTMGIFAMTSLPSIDYAELQQREAWLHHPILGDPSFDTFKRLSGNPIFRGAPPYEWPVNGFLFEDPVSKDWFVYVGEYAENYVSDAQHDMKCTVLRSRDKGKSWERLGGIFPETPHLFDGDSAPVGAAPDVSVVYHDGRYHLIYDYLVKGATWPSITRVEHPDSNGVGYAWADKPEGPFTRTARPVYRTGDHPFYYAKYRRGYAATLIRRANDWMVLMMLDSGPYFGWVLIGMRSPNPEGPYSDPVFLRSVEDDYFYPPLLEYFPAFAREGWIYAPATSVAKNRNYQAVFRARTEDAMKPEAWETFQAGSVWHAERVENEHWGIWGQAFSGSCAKDGMFNVMFPSRDQKGMGTINLASRKWDKPYRKQGFVMTGHFAPSLSLLDKDFSAFTLSVKMKTEGRVEILFGYQGALGPDKPTADAAPHAQSLRNYQAIVVENEKWRMIRVGNDGVEQMFSEGTFTGNTLVVKAPGDPTKPGIEVNGHFIGDCPNTHGGIGLLVGEHSRAEVGKFEIRADAVPARRNYLYTEALLGAAQSMQHWNIVKDAAFRFGEGSISTAYEVRAKWNVHCRAFTLYAPQGPQYGSAELLVDGKVIVTLDFHAETSRASHEIFKSEVFPEGNHAIVLRPAEKSVIPLDSLKAIL